MLKSKLRSSSGATILLALLFFLMCAVAGSVVLAAGTASSGRIAGLKEDEQSYYTVTSAAQLLRDAIDGEVYSRYITAPAEAEGNHYNQQPDGELSQLLLYHADTIFDHVNAAEPTGESSTEEFTVSADEFEKVEATLTMKSDYSIEILLKDEADNYSCMLRIPAAISLDKETSTAVDEHGNEYTKTTTTLTWTEGTITQE